MSWFVAALQKLSRGLIGRRACNSHAQKIPLIPPAMQSINRIPTGNTRMSANLKKETLYFRTPESCLHVSSEDKEMAVGKGIVEKLCIVI